MGTILRTLVAFAACVLLPASALAQKVTYDNYGARDFSHLKTFAFKAPPQDDAVTPTGTAYDDPFVRQRTWDAIAAQLTRRGLTRDDEQPDLYVIAHRTFKEQTVYYPYSWEWGYPYGWGWGGWTSGWGYGAYGSYPVEIIRGTLIVDFQDAATGQLMWRGVGQREIHPMSKPEKRTARVNREVEKIFKKFPEAATGAVGTSGHDVPRPR